LNPEEYPNRGSVYSLFQDVKSDVVEYINSLEEAELVRIPERFYGPVWQVLLHMVNHGTDHRSQILRILHDFESPTFNQDYILLAWKR